MAYALSRKGHTVEIVMLPFEKQHVTSINQRRINTLCFPNVKLSHSITATLDTSVVGSADYIIHAIPVQYTYNYLHRMKDEIPPTVPIVSVSKGIESNRIEFLNELIPSALGRKDQPLAFLAGPSFAKEIMKGDPTSVTVASSYPKLARAVQVLFSSLHFIVLTTDDVVGVEVASALKNVLAIACGVVSGLGYGANTKAALVTVC